MKTYTRRFTSLFTVFMLLATLGPAGGADSLFLEAGVKDGGGEALVESLPSDWPAALRARAVELDPVWSSDPLPKDGADLEIPLFDGQSVLVENIRRRPTTNGTLALRGKVSDSEHGFFVLSSDGGRSLGRLDLPGRGERYLLLSGNKDGGHYLLKLDPAAGEIECAGCGKGGHFVSGSEGADAVAGKVVSKLGPQDPAEITVMVLYTTAAETWANSSGGGINNVITQLMQSGQEVLDNSQVGITLNLVHSAAIGYAEAESMGDDLDALTSPNDGVIDNVHDLRDQYRADLVHLLVEREDSGGLAWLLNNASGRPNLGFSIGRVQQVAWTFTSIHEMGHNMGLSHHKEQNSQAGPGLFDYSAGWRWVGNDSNRYCSIMSYEGGQYFADGETHSRVAHVSDPGINYLSVATGDASDADNARNLREVKHAIADYRQAPSNGAPSLQAVAEAPGGGIALSWSNGSATPVQFLGLVWDIYESDYLENVGGGGGVWFPFASNLAQGDIAVPHSGAYFVWLGNQYGDGSLYLTPQPEVVVTRNAPPHAPNGLAASDFGLNTIEVSWQPELYGTFVYWFIVNDWDSASQTGVFTRTDGPLGTAQFWHYLSWSQADFQAGSTQFTLPGNGEYFVFCWAMGWDGLTWGDSATAYINLP